MADPHLSRRSGSLRDLHDDVPARDPPQLLHRKRYSADSRSWCRPIRRWDGSVDRIRETRGTNVSDALSRKWWNWTTTQRCPVSSAARRTRPGASGCGADARVQDIGEQFIAWGESRCVTNSYCRAEDRIPGTWYPSNWRPDPRSCRRLFDKTIRLVSTAKRVTAELTHRARMVLRCLATTISKIAQLGNPSMEFPIGIVRGVIPIDYPSPWTRPIDPDLIDATLSAPDSPAASRARNFQHLTFRSELARSSRLRLGEWPLFDRQPSLSIGPYWASDMVLLGSGLLGLWEQEGI